MSFHRTLQAGLVFLVMSLAQWCYAAGEPVTNCPNWRPCGPGPSWGGNKDVPQKVLGVDGRPICQRHDDCYDDPTRRRRSCDKALHRELRCACQDSTNPRRCRRLAFVAYVSVRILGASDNTWIPPSQR